MARTSWRGHNPGDRAAAGDGLKYRPVPWTLHDLRREGLDCFRGRELQTGLACWPVPPDGGEKIHQPTSFLTFPVRFAG